jgi:hypothetical protein
VEVSAGSRRTRSSRKKEIRKKVVDNMPNYIGITGRTMHARQMEHSRAVHAGDTKNAMAKHVKEAPANTEHKFTMRMISKHRSNLEKAVTEGILLEKQDKYFIMNKKSECGKKRGVVRLTAARN